jgi:hypothetical protein
MSQKMPNSSKGRKRKTLPKDLNELLDAAAVSGDYGKDSTTLG